MLRIKSFLHPLFPRLHNNVYKLYSKAAGQPEPVLNLPDASCAQTEAACSPPKSPPIDKVSREVSCAQTQAASSPTKFLPINKELRETENSVESSRGEDKIAGGGSCNRTAATKSRKGKKCGQPKPVGPQDPGPPGGYYIQDKCDIYDIPKTNAKKWKTISYTLVPLALGLSAFVLATKEEGPEPEYIPYEYMYRRTKRFPWRNGKTSLFHGPNNLIPEEEEERLDQEAEEKKAQAPPPATPKKGETAPSPPEKEMRYKKRVNEEEDKVKKREQHAQEELKRRKKRHEEERAKMEIDEVQKEQ